MPSCRARLISHAKGEEYCIFDEGHEGPHIYGEQPTDHPKGEPIVLTTHGTAEPEPEARGIEKVGVIEGSLRAALRVAIGRIATRERQIEDLEGDVAGWKGIAKSNLAHAAEAERQLEAVREWCEKAKVAAQEREKTHPEQIEGATECYLIASVILDLLNSPPGEGEQCETCGGDDREGGSVGVGPVDEFGNRDSDDCPDPFHDPSSDDSKWHRRSDTFKAIARANRAEAEKARESARALYAAAETLTRVQWPLGTNEREQATLRLALHDHAEYAPE